MNRLLLFVFVIATVCAGAGMAGVFFAKGHTPSPPELSESETAADPSVEVVNQVMRNLRDVE